jgi:hypothetical protein
VQWLRNTRAKKNFDRDASGQAITACPLTGDQVTTKKPSKPEAKRAAAYVSEIARVSLVARRYVIEMAATATMSASVLLCLFVARHYT